MNTQHIQKHEKNQTKNTIKKQKLNVQSKMMTKQKRVKYDKNVCRLFAFK